MSKLDFGINDIPTTKQGKKAYALNKRLKLLISDIYDMIDKQNRTITEKELGMVNAIFFCINEIKKEFYGNKR